MIITSIVSTPCIEVFICPPQAYKKIINGTKCHVITNKPSLLLADTDS